MTKTYTLRERATGNGNPVAVAVPNRSNGNSGSLPIGTTFYYKVIANGYSDFYDDLNAWLSAPSNEVNATTDASNRVIWIHFDNDVSGQEETTVIRTTVSGDYNMTNSSGTLQRHFPRVTGYRSTHYMGVRTNITTKFDRFEMTTSAIASLSPGETITGATSGATALVVTNPAGGTTFKVWTVSGTFQAGETLNGSVSGLSVGTYSSLSAKDGWVMEDFDSATAYCFPVFENGAPCLEFDSDDPDDPVTLQDIYEWSRDNSKDYIIDGYSLFPDDSYKTSNGYNLCNMFRVNCNLYCSGNGKIEAGTGFSQALNKHMFRSGNFEINRGFIIGAWHLGFYNTIARSSGSEFNGNASMMGLHLENSSSCNRNPYYQTTYDINLNNCIVESSGRWNSAGEINDSRMIVRGEIGNITGQITGRNASFNSYIATFYAKSEGRWSNFIVNAGLYMVFMDTYYVGYACKVLEFINTTWEEGFTYWARLKFASVGADEIFFDKYSLDLNIVDADGNPIENAQIYITDKDGNNALENTNYDAITYTQLLKTGTSMTLSSGSVTVGKYYRSGDEIIKIVSDNGGSNYTIARAQLGTTANNIGGGTTNKISTLREIYDYIETDSNGDANTNLIYRYYKALDGTNTSGYYIYENDLVLRSPYKIIIKKQGYETYIIDEYTPDKKREMVIKLKKSSYTRDINT